MRFLTEYSRSHPCLFPLQLGNLLSSMKLLRNILILSSTTPVSHINPDTTTLQSCHTVISDYLDGDLIHRTAVGIEGSAGPSGIDGLHGV